MSKMENSLLQVGVPEGLINAKKFASKKRVKCDRRFNEQLQKKKKIDRFLFTSE